MICPVCGKQMERLFVNAWWFGVQVCECGYTEDDRTPIDDEDDDDEDDDDEMYPLEGDDE